MEREKLKRVVVKYAHNAIKGSAVPLRLAALASLEDTEGNA